MRSLLIFFLLALALPVAADTATRHRVIDGELDKMADAARSAMRGDSHDKLMDAVTEATRASPYGAAHVAVVVGSALVAIILALVALG